MHERNILSKDFESFYMKGKRKQKYEFEDKYYKGFDEEKNFFIRIHFFDRNIFAQIDSYNETVIIEVFCFRKK